MIVDPTNLENGLHYYEVYGIDSKAPWRGPLFRISVTITKPMAVINCPPTISFAGMQFCPGTPQSYLTHIVCLFLVIIQDCLI